MNGGRIDPTCFSPPHVGQIFSDRLVVFFFTGKFKLFIMAGSLNWWRWVVNVYASNTLFVAGIYRAAAPSDCVPALLHRFMGGVLSAGVSFGHSHSVTEAMPRFMSAE